MALSLPATHAPLGVPQRLLLFAAAVALGFIGGLAWSLEISTWAYDGLIRLVADPGIRIASQAMGVGMGFLLGFVHITTICYLPAALAALPLIQAAHAERDWPKTVAVLALSMVVVTALFGVLLSAPASLLAGIVGSRRTMSQIMQPTLVATGLLMMVVALGELGLIRRLLPELHLAPAAGAGAPAGGARARYRRAAVLGVTMAATFGIICPKPLYLALLVYVAVVGNLFYGALALGAYGLGLATSAVLAGSLLLPASRGARISAWLACRRERIHLVQGLIFAATGALAVAFFWVRYGPLIPQN